MRPVRSMIEFKQIIGRGTRLYDGKDYFTIYDFVKAYEHFNDPEWDGEPLEPEPVTPRPPRGGEDDPPSQSGDPGDPLPPEPRPERITIRLADGKERAIQHMSVTSFWSPDGRPMSAAQFIEKLFGELPALFKDEDELRRIWGSPDTRKALLEGLAEKGFADEQLREISKIISAERSDVFDVLAYIAFAMPPISRHDRVESRKPKILSSYDDKLQLFLDYVLSQYVKEGVSELDQDKLPALLQLKYRGFRRRR